MFQNDKTAIYEFIFIDHIVFIFMEEKGGGWECWAHLPMV
jgi:hypothetical protein